MKQEIIQEPDERLSVVSLPVSHEAAKALARDLIDSMGETDLGIAAPQIGCPVRVIVAKIPTLTVMVNPSWEPAGAKRPGIEGCLSVDNATKRLRIFRHIGIEAHWTDLEGEKHNANLTGRDAVVFQHEVDHLDGITINRK